MRQTKCLLSPHTSETYSPNTFPILEFEAASHNFCNFPKPIITKFGGVKVCRVLSYKGVFKAA